MKSQIRKETRSFSNTCTKQILRQLISENDQPLFSIPINTNNNIRTIDLQKCKLNQGVSFLQKQIQKQTAQLLIAKQQLKKQFILRQQSIKLLQLQKQKNQKLHQLNVSNTKIIGQLKRKLEKLEKQNSQNLTKRQQLDTKYKKIQLLLKKKEDQVKKAQLKVNQNTNNQKKFQQQRQQLKKLRQLSLKFKIQQQKWNNERHHKSKEIKQLEQKLRIKSQTCMFLQQSNKRLQDQCVQLQNFYNQQANQVQAIQSKMNELAFAKDLQIDQLKSQTQRLRVTNDQHHRPMSIYMNEIKRILKQHIKDKNLRGEVQKKIAQIVIQMDQGWNKILINALTQK